MSAHGFVWYELMTSDIDAALGFYGPLLGWTSQDFSSEPRYAVVSRGEHGVGGIMPMPPGVPRPFWIGYVGTPSIDDTAAALREAGGTVHKGPWEIPQVGRLAIVSDPHGAPFALLQGASESASQAFQRDRPGHGNWNELATPDSDKALAFYGDVFGWTKGAVHDMGPAGPYTMIQAGGVDIGGASKPMPGAPPGWLFYFGVGDIHQALAQVQAGGGTVLSGPHEVPGGSLILHAKDPQGAIFALVEPPTNA